MAVKLLMQPGKAVKKSNALARARWSPDSVWEPRLVAMLAAQIKAGDTDFQTYEIRLIDLLGKEPGGKDYKELKEAVCKAMSRVITINDDKGWSMYNLFSKCRLDSNKGTLEICFHPDLKDHYLQLKQYIKYNLVEFMLLPSTYSQRLFEFLRSWADRKEVAIDLKELHEMLNTPQSLRKDFRNFRVRVLQKAHKDITEKTSLYYEWEAIKNGRAFSEIKFTFAKNPKKTSHSISKQAEDLVHEVLGIAANAGSSQSMFKAFCGKFQDGRRNNISAGKLWHDMRSKGIAPTADDVPEDNELGVMEFLIRWGAEHTQVNR